jgi:hypothetical protein
MPQRIVYPVLNIYLGTSPIEVGRYVSHELRRLPETDQRKVASLYIDTMPIQEERINGQRMYGSDTMQIVIPRYQGSGAWSHEQRHNLYVETNGTVRQHKPGITAAGAGGVRNNGHVAFCSWASSIQQSISDKLDLINAPPPVVQDERAAASLRVNIVAFLGGGTGSGVLPSLAVMTRYVLTRKNVVPQTAIYAVLPEQPRGATEDMRRRQRSNAYSTLLELTALLRLRNQQAGARFHFGALQLDVAALQLVDVIYLYGHGKLTDHSEIYEHIGMDLFTRMQDGHGAGHERMRQLPDLSGLQETDDRGLPAFIATSGVTEIIFPREELIGAWARHASRAVLATQTSELRAEDQSQVEKFSSDLAAEMLDRLQNELDAAQTRHAPEPFDAFIIDEGEGWWDQLQERKRAYQKELRFSRDEIVRGLKDEFAGRVQSAVVASRDAVFDRYVCIYGWMHEVVKRAANAAPSVISEERDLDFEEHAFNPGFLRRRRVGRFANYANDLLGAAVESNNAENRRLALETLAEWLTAEGDVREKQFAAFRLVSASGDSSVDRQLIEEGRLPHSHKYTRSALPSGELVRQLYLYLLRQAGLEKDGDLNVTRVLDELQAEQRRGAADLSDTLLEQFFARRFRAALQSRDQAGGMPQPKTVLELIVQFGGETLLRQHLRWGMEWARGHLNYDPYQEARTNGRVARQLDVAMMLRGTGNDVRAIMNEETTRAEVQNGMRLLNALDPDQITFLYTEYAIAIRAIDGMHEPSDSYLADYRESQRKWMANGIMPPHSSTLFQEEVGRPLPDGPPLLTRFADDGTMIPLTELYTANGHGDGSQP